MILLKVKQITWGFVDAAVVGVVGVVVAAVVAVGKVNLEIESHL